MIKPTVSVVMTVHNGLPYLTEALESILRQSFEDFELIAIDDASTDKTLAALQTVRDRRVRILKNKKKLGLSRSLNKGIAASRGKYIARMDSDDISLRERFANQVYFLENHPEIDILGTWAKAFGEGKHQIWKYPLEDSEIKAEMLFNSNLVHSSVMVRASALKEHRLAYDPKVHRAQDFELWSRASKYVRFANLAQPLILYRLHSGQVGKQHVKEQQAVAARVRKKQLESLGLRPSRAQLDLHNRISTWVFPKNLKGLVEVEKWLSGLFWTNKKAKIYSQQALRKVLERRWLAACRSAVGLGRPAWDAYKESQLTKSTMQPVLWGKAMMREFRLR